MFKCPSLAVKEETISFLHSVAKECHHDEGRSHYTWWAGALRAITPRQSSYGQRATFAYQLGTMLQAGVPLLQSLQALRGLPGSRGMKRFLARLIRDIKSGQSFSAALERAPEHLDSLFLQAAREGEANGQLGLCLSVQAERLATTQRSLRQLLNDLVYPSFACLMALAFLLLMVSISVGTFEELYQDMELELPALTQLVIKVSSAIQRYGLAWLGIVLSAPVILKILETSKACRWHVHRVVLLLPILGSLFFKVTLGRVSRSLGSLLQSGVPLLKAIQVAACVAPQNEVMAYGFRKAMANLKQGDGLTVTLLKQRVIDPFSAAILDAGEVSGSVPQAFLRMADTCDSEVECQFKILSNSIPVLMIIAASLIVGMTTIALFLPFFTCCSGCCSLMGC